MVRPSTGMAAVVLALGLLIGESLADREPEAGIDAGSIATLESPVITPPRYRVPYVDSPQPVRVYVPSVGIAADVRPVGMSDAATMQVPSDIAVVGWFDRSVLPISRSGNSVLVGHRDGARDPNGVFRELGSVRRGGAIHVHDQAGRRISYSVRRVDVMSDAEFARRAFEVFRNDGPHRLVLITCGGYYDETRGGYQSTVVVVATRT